MRDGASRVWVARPEPGAARTAARLAALGHAPLVAPVLVLVATSTLPPAGPFDAALLTSAAGAAPLAALLPPGTPVLAVGARTAAAARAAGLDTVAEAGGDAAALASLVRARFPPGARLLHAAGEDRKKEPAATLQDADYRVETWIAYAACPARVLPEAAARALDTGALDAVLHYSRRSAETLLALAAGHPALARLAHHCLSPDVAVPLRAAGLDPIVAPRPVEDALLAGLRPPSRA